MTWRPLTLANTKETQAELESIIGLNRATFGAGPYLAQGNAGAFPDAPASERQAIIASALDPKGYWPKAAKAAAEERLAAERAIEGTRAQIADREEIVAGAADLPSLIDAIKDRDDARSLAHTADAATEQAQERVGANAAAVERHRATAAAERTAEQERARAVTALTEAAAAAQQIPDAERSLTDLDAKIARIPRLEQEAEDHRAALSQHQIAKEQHNAANAVAASALTASRDAYTKGEKMMRDAQELQATIEHLELSADAARHCTLCEQVLTDEGRAATLANLRTQLRNMDADILTHAPEIIRTEREAQEAREIADAITVPDLPPLFDNAPRLAEAREAATSRGVVSAMLAGYRRASACARTVGAGIRKEPQQRPDRHQQDHRNDGQPSRTRPGAHRSEGRRCPSSPMSNRHVRSGCQARGTHRAHQRCRGGTCHTARRHQPRTRSDRNTTPRRARVRP